MTVQIKDVITYDKENHSTKSDVLAQFFQKYPKKKPKKKFHFSALWRGYTCRTEIEDNKLYIRSLSFVSSKPHGSALYDSFKKTFPNRQDHFLNWFSGIIIISTEPNPDHPNSYRGFPIYEVNQLLEVIDGIHTQTRTFSYDELETFRKKQFQSFKTTDDYLQLKNEEIARIKKENEIRKNSDEKLTQFSLRTFSESDFENTIELRLFDYVKKFY